VRTFRFLGFSGGVDTLLELVREADFTELYQPVGGVPVNFIKTCTTIYICIILELKRLRSVFVISIHVAEQWLLTGVMSQRPFVFISYPAVMAMRYHWFRKFLTAEGFCHDLFAGNRTEAPVGCACIAMAGNGA
jgi:hypothetical protein